MTTNADAVTRSRRVMPGGVSSPVRAFGSVGGDPRFVAHATGSRVTDVDGREYVDMVGSWGPMILGHAHPAVVEAVRRAALASPSFGAPCLAELELAEAIVAKMAPFVQKVRFTSSGTEAVMTAVRLARAATGRDVVVKFAGCYHGHADSMLVAAGSGIATLGLPDSPGVPAATAQQTVVLPYGDLDAVEQLFRRRGEEIAAVITESVPANMGVVVPPEGFNAGVVRVAHAHGALVILDEVLAGFRASEHGGWGLDGRREGWVPDLVTFGKVVGGGLPLAAVGGSDEIMLQLAPAGPVYQAGTLSGNPLASAAGLATLQRLDATVYDTLNERADRIIELVEDALNSAGVPHVVNRAGTLFSVFFTDQPVTDYASASTQDRQAHRRFFHAALDAGLWLPPSAFEAWFVSTALTDADLELAGQALHAGARAAAEG